MKPGMGWQRIARMARIGLPQIAQMPPDGILTFYFCLLRFWGFEILFHSHLLSGVFRSRLAPRPCRPSPSSAAARQQFISIEPKTNRLLIHPPVCQYQKLWQQQQFQKEPAAYLKTKCCAL